MPIDATNAIVITCDNPTCPGPPASLSPNDRHGWILITVEVYGAPMQPFVFCTKKCAGQGLAAAKLNMPANA